MCVTVSGKVNESCLLRQTSTNEGTKTTFRRRASVGEKQIPRVTQYTILASKTTCQHLCLWPELYIVWDIFNLCSFSCTQKIPQAQYSLTCPADWQIPKQCVRILVLQPNKQYVFQYRKSMTANWRVLSHKSHNALNKYVTMHHFVTEMCTHVYISVTEWYIVGYLSNALWDLCNRSIQSAF